MKQRKNLPKFRVVITDIGKKDLQQIKADLRAKLLENLKILESSPFPTIKPIKKIKASRNIPLFRLRSGDYRIIFHVRDTTVYVFTVINRKDFDSAIKNVVKSVEKWIKNI